MLFGDLLFGFSACFIPYAGLGEKHGHCHTSSISSLFIKSIQILWLGLLWPVTSVMSVAYKKDINSTAAERFEVMKHIIKCHQNAKDR